MAKRGISWLERDNQTFFFVVLTHSYICLAAAAGECLSADSYLHVFFILERKKKVFYVIASNVVNYERERKKKDGRKESFVGLRSRRVIGLVARGLSKATDRKMEMSVAERVKGVTGV